MADYLDVYIAGRHAGTLGEQDGLLSFAYDSAYDGPGLSVHMPRALDGPASFSGLRVKAWFDGLLPDAGQVRDGMAAGRGYKGSSTFRLLEDYGLDLPGAVQVARGALDSSASDGLYVPLSRSEIGARLEALAGDILPSWQGKGERWSLAGNQEKVALRFFDGVYWSCRGRAASNVIVKPGVTRLSFQALDEAVSMRLARACGLPVAGVRYERFGSVGAIVVDRYDRITDPVTGDVERVHQEDLCQALGVHPSKKYAVDGGPTSADCVELLRRHLSSEDVLRFADALFFNYLIAGTDAHAKNYSLLHLPGEVCLLAPLYDVASYLPYVSGRRERVRLAMNIGGVNEFGKLSRSGVLNLARQCGVDAVLLRDRFLSIASAALERFDGCVDEFAQAEGIDELASRFKLQLEESCRGVLARIGTNWSLASC